MTVDTRITRRAALRLLMGAGLLSASIGDLVAQIGAAHPVPQVQPKAGTAVADFVDVARAAGLTATTVIGGEESKKFILETTGGGVAVFDYDNDGWLDIFLVNGTKLVETADARKSTHHLYKNNRDGTFTDVTERAGLVHHGWGQGVCVGDYNGDGYLDLFVTFYGKNVLYRNNGNGTFTDVTHASGLLTEDNRYSTGAAFLDTRRSGWLDLFVAHYVDYEQAVHSSTHVEGCKWRGIQVMCGPRGLKGARNTLYRNRGDGTFEDVSAAAGVLAGEHYGFSPLVMDYDNDGWPDIYVANDSTASQLYRNKHDGTFTEVGMQAGVAYNEDGREQSGMGADAADYDGDGQLDVVKTNFEQDTSTLYHNRGDGTFDDVTFPAGLGVNTSFVGWGTGFLDFNNDGHPDIFMANGHVYPEVDHSLGDTAFKERKILYRNRGDGTFEDVSLRSGPGILLRHSSRGVAFGDLFNTGQTDIVINNMNDAPTLLHNYMPAKQHAIAVQLIGNAPNSFAIGARVTVSAGPLRTFNEVRSGGSYLSQNDLRLRFGLGDAKVADAIEIRWPDGHVDTLRKIAGDQLVAIAYGGRIVTTTPFASTPHRLQGLQSSP
jgi:hypothetical protein